MENASEELLDTQRNLLKPIVVGEGREPVIELKSSTTDIPLEAIESFGKGLVLNEKRSVCKLTGPCILFTQTLSQVKLCSPPREKIIASSQFMGQ